MKTRPFFLLFIMLVTPDLCKAQECWWPQFRGANNSGIAADNAKPPIQFDANNLLWKTELPMGNSSPVIWEDKIFLTAYESEKKEFQTICLNRETGKIEWLQSICLIQRAVIIP